MAVSSIGNLTYINQNAQIGASAQAHAQHRGDIAHLANMQDFQNRLGEVQEVKKLEENEALNPDRDSKRQRQEDQDRQKRHLQEQAKEKTCFVSDHILDIKA
ncbi:hypothetical protein [Helicobacter kayseriensis]|uniref:hypothetical protein n=1 Tax=Helicobacter kayseriensis TaxID=2905877 RepID=UPI001E597A36|nr:hypothetical protein [Helicobacter kayseriensis]MCE3047049.1 hypothetical protein [Helicobacter kayseriensis]MCE3048291.1 hypothetical protein [Helicobacter kayseriensis]